MRSVSNALSNTIFNTFFLSYVQKTKSEKRTNLFPMLTTIAFIDKWWIPTQYLITRFPLVVPTLIRQILNTMDEREMFALQNGENHISKTLITVKYMQNIVIVIQKT
jgi:hypothetical protein